MCIAYGTSVTSYEDIEREGDTRLEKRQLSPEDSTTYESLALLGKKTKLHLYETVVLSTAKYKWQQNMEQHGQDSEKVGLVPSTKFMQDFWNHIKNRVKMQKY